MFGRISFDPGEPLASPVLEQMLDAAADPREGSRQIYAAPGIALAATVPAKHPPSPGVAGRHVAADARLINAAALRRELTQLGHRFSGIGDDEVILRAYEQWGVRGFARLRGPFACAIWDARAHRLTLARDHVGLRPLYFAVLPDQGIVFGTELRALLRDPGVGREWSPAAIDAYLTLGYVPAPLTVYHRISKVEPAHVLVVEGRRLHLERYWDLPAPVAQRRETDAVAMIGDCLRAAVADHAGGPGAGLLYSGGTASTALVAMAAPSDWPAVVSIGCEQQTADGERSARAAGLLGRRCDMVSARPDFQQVAGDLAASAHEPVADPAAVTGLAIAGAARQHMEYGLAGHGAATLWADYARHRVERVEMTVRAWLGRRLATVGGELARSLSGAVRGARALAHLRLSPADACAVKHVYGFWDEACRRTLYTREFAWQVRDHDPLLRHVELYVARDTADALDRALYVDAHTFLPDGLLAAAQPAGRALPLHLPMLDPDVVECVAAMPSALKSRGGAGMYALRRLLARELPASLMPAARRRPARHAWLAPALRAFVPAILLGPRFDGRGIVSRPALQQLWDEHQAGRGHHAHRLWSLVMLELWFRNAVDGNAADVPLEYAVLKAA